MGLLAAIATDLMEIGDLLARRAYHQTTSLARRLMAIAGFLLLAFTILGLGIVFLVGGLFFTLSGEPAIARAAVITGGIVAGTGLILLAMTLAIGRN